ncbi:histidine decarboxylase-like [Dysidea avara]|uniref:histidine decarboxylase-like n=1 Tax=Dysidea avara TaxID=196820 RepID=UPI0033205D25
MSENIPYGPDRKPWRETLSSLAISGNSLKVSPPSQDPLQLYSFPKLEEGITPTFYQVPSKGLTENERKQAQEETAQHTKQQTANFLGYQVSLGEDYTDVVPNYLNTSVNNVGDPFVSGTYTLNTKWMERNVLDHYASLWNAKWPHDARDPDTYWGYVLTMGSSEGNIYGLWNARDYLEGKFMLTDESLEVPVCYYTQAKTSKDKTNAYTPVAFYSQETHYSVVKAISMLHIKTYYEVAMELYPDSCPLDGEWPVEVPSAEGDTGPGHVDEEKLCKLVEFFAEKGYPVLIIFNYGTTFKGAYDNVQKVGEMLMPILKKHGMDERNLEITNPDTGKTITCPRKGYWIHVDGALGASYMPFVQMAYDQGRTNIKPAPVFDFRLPFVCSIITSGHKFPGMPWPTGIFMTKTDLQLLPPSRPDVIGSPDTTFAGSRSGLSALLWWTYISTHSYEKQLEEVLNCLKLAEYTEKELEKVEKEISRDIWIARTPLALSLRFRKPNNDIVHKYTLASEEFYHGNELRQYTHMYIMKGADKKKIDNLMQELRKPDAFPEDKPTVQATPLDVGTAFTTVTMLKRWVSAAKQNLHNGMVVGKEDAGIIKGIKPLLGWPRQGRGFK